MRKKNLELVGRDVAGAIGIDAVVPFSEDHGVVHPVMDDNDKGDHGKMLYTRLRLWQFTDKYILEPIDVSSDSYLSISRTDGSSSLIAQLPKCTTQSPSVRPVFGVIGMLKLLVGSSVTKCRCQFERLVLKKTEMTRCKRRIFDCLEQTQMQRNTESRDPGRGKDNREKMEMVNWKKTYLMLYRQVLGVEESVLQKINDDPIGHRHSMEMAKCNEYVATIFNIVTVSNEILFGSYLLVVTERECVGSYLGHPIYKVSGMQILPCNNSLKNSSSEQKKMESEFSVLLEAAQSTPGLYFSYDVNLTLCLQKLHELGNDSKMVPLWRQAEPRFLWNSYMLEALIDNKVRFGFVYATNHPRKYPDIVFCSFVFSPVLQVSSNLLSYCNSLNRISGFQSFQAAIGSQIIDVTLIARRCTRRAGTRMWRRGADSEGYVANFVESEQILQTNGFTASFVQIRGSMPFLWEQIVDLTYKPKFDIVRPDEASRVAERHFLDLNKKYGSVVAVDLVNQAECSRQAEECSKIGSPDELNELGGGLSVPNGSDEQGWLGQTK
ncbi:hypothetical protein ZIOFF_026126 [Zingiber officinale]|uniref:SAC domain-containing protein n=1 Tax=Zingiber officinale TaxID=94328 RepID=A0A8J5GYN5_ZINOF|nr:hypothetical protein ZIOFF_026126 [Zingiber officinale]